ncbi:BTAD domain-containing putative transcriptional regulator [Thermopolyspora sp. NPDC052614]|uniref:AfsR/SARP family transcriptional regulator n=1 Tax=Thermopolyspora sp. NPDC052614 TaxID=3155682 RepID=UPI0034256D23
MNGVIFRLLTRGPGLWLDVGGREQTAGTPKEQCLLAILLMSPNQAVSVEKISDRIWGEPPSDTTRRTIDRYVTKIRRQLRPLADRVRIIGKQGTYTILVDPESIDVCRFNRLHIEADAAAQQDALERAIELYRAAESLCGGDPLAGLPGTWARAMGRVLADKLFEIRRARIALEVRLGRYTKALNELPGMVEQRPDDEILAAHLMTALAASGRRTEALAVYRTTRAYVVETTGLEPGRHLVKLHQRLLRADDELTDEPLGDVPRLNPFPDDVPHFVGREREMELIAAVRADRKGAGLVVIEGMPGVGKTALAVHAAHHLADGYPQGRLYLDLKAHDPEQPPLDARTALAELLRMTGVPPSRIPATLDERSAMWRKRAATLRAIVILDDADGLEHIRPLLPGDPDQMSGLMLVTSRVRVDLIPGMRRVPLRELTERDSATLWSRLTDDGPPPVATRRMLRICAGLPLAIHELALRLREPGGNPLIRRVPKITEAVRLSYRRLPAERQRAFRRLGLYPGEDMTVDVVSVLTGMARDAAEELVDALLRRHLIEEGEHGRYRLHRLVRGVARDLARQDDPARDNRAAERRLLCHYIQAVDAADRALFPNRWKTFTVPENDGREPLDSATAQAWFDAEWRNVLKLARYAAEHEWQAQCAQLTHLMAEYLDFQHLYAEAAQAHTLAVRACGDTGDRLAMARAALDLGLVRFRTAFYDESIHQVEKARGIYEAHGCLREKAKCLEWLGLAHYGKDRRRKALAVWGEAADIYRDLGDKKGTADVLRYGAMARWGLGRFADSDRLFDEALRIYREIGDRYSEIKTLNNKGHVAQSTARHREADRLYRQALVILKNLTGQDNHAILDHNQGDLHKYRKQYETALECYGRALAAYQESGDRQNQIDVLNGIAEVYLDMARPEVAFRHFQEAKIMAEDVGCRSQEARALAGIAATRRDLDHHEFALRLYDEALAMVREIDDPLQQAKILDGQALTLLRSGDRDGARMAWREARGLYEDMGLSEFAEAITLHLQTHGGISGHAD